MKYNKFLEDLELIDEEHKNFSIETPLRDDAFEISDDEKISIIQKNVKEILETLGMDMTDDSLNGTPKRVAKAYVKELFGGLNPKSLPTSSTFENKYQYGEMLVEKNITVFTLSDWVFYFLSRKNVRVVYECHDLTNIRKKLVSESLTSNNSKIICINKF